jgi:hypothetical protein
MTKLVKVIICLFIICIYGCGGSKVKNQKKVVALPEQRQALVQASDENMSVSLDWILTRNSPESWAKNADWDEYIFRLIAQPGHQVRVTNIVVYDSLGTSLTHMDDRSELKKASKQTIRRYKDAKLSVKPGAGAAAVSAGATGAVLGMAYVSGAAAGGGSAGMVGGLAAGTAVVGVAVILTPVFIVAGIFRGVNHHKVTNEIHNISVVFPFSIDDKQVKDAHVFFPFAPSPNYVEITYADSMGEHKLNIDTKQVLSGLHMAKDKK